MHRVDASCSVIYTWCSNSWVLFKDKRKSKTGGKMVCSKFKILKNARAVEIDPSN
jgi:hypothetical protein